MVGGEGTPARSGCLGGGEYPSQVWMVGGGVPQPGLDGGGDPGYPLGQVWMMGGTPHPTMTGWGTPLPPPTSIGSTCYAVGGMPLAFTQEDFLVKFKCFLESTVRCYHA